MLCFGHRAERIRPINASAAAAAATTATAQPISYSYVCV